jgi:glycosyltransferase involved in cell wall biosynthesis
LRVAFATNICAHYRVRTFETLARYYDVDYFFFSAGDDWYWQQEHGVRAGRFCYEYLPGIRLGRTRVTPSLPWKLWRGDYEVYVKCINGRFALPATYLIARLRRKPFVLWTGIWMRLQTPFHRLVFPVTRYVLRHADAIVVYGKHVKRYLTSEGVQEERIFVAAHAVDNDAYNRKVLEEEKADLRINLGIPAGQKVVLYLGRLERVKGLRYLLEAFASLRREDVTLVLAGNGSELPHLKRIVEREGMTDRVRFAGYVPSEQATLFYALAYVYVLPSVTLPEGKELWGLVINEAFNQGVPVITTEAVGAAAGGLVQEGVNGFVIPERDTTALARALEKILDEPALREQLGRNAQKTIMSWDNEQMVEGFRRAIDYVTQNH